MTRSPTPNRPLNYGSGPPPDGHEREWDICPECGNKRWQLIIVPDRFHCDRCCKAGPGPNAEVKQPEPEQLGLGVEYDDIEVAVKPEEDRPPIDEGMAWIAEEMPDE